MQVKMLVDTSIEGKPAMVGEIAECSEQDARFLIAMKFAVKVENKENPPAKTKSKAKK